MALKISHPPIHSVLLAAVIAAALAPLPGARAASSIRLSMDDYLAQVRRQNEAVTSSALTAGGSLKRSEEGDLILSPTLFGNAQLSEDEKVNPFFPLRKTVANTYQLG